MTQEMADFEFQELPGSQKELLLELLGYSVDSEGFVVDVAAGERVKCRYTQEYVLLRNASILPGSTIIINTSAYTLSSYISEFLERAEEDGNR